MQVPLWITAFCVAALGSVALLLICVKASLYGDGSYYLLRVLGGQAGESFPGRAVVNAVREIPVDLGIGLGVTDVHVLAILQSVGFILFPAAVYTAALILASRNAASFVLVTVSSAICFSSLIFFSVGEVLLGLALITLTAVLLVKPTEWTIAESITVVFANAVLLATHESLAPCCLLIAVQALFRWRARLGNLDQIISVAAAALAAGAVAWTVWTWSSAPNGNAGSFFSGVTHLSPRSVLLLLLAGLAICIWALTPRFQTRALTLVVLMVVLALMVVGVAAELRGLPSASYGARGLCVVAVLALQLALFALWLWGPEFSGAHVNLGACLVAAAFLLVLLVVPVSRALSWNAFLGDVRGLVTTKSGVLQESALSSPELEYMWPWTNPTLSVLLRSSPDDAILLNSNPPFRPFVQEDAAGQLAARYTWH